jgi:hypothetical protein
MAGSAYAFGAFMITVQQYKRSGAGGTSPIRFNPLLIASFEELAHGKRLLVSSVKSESTQSKFNEVANDLAKVLPPSIVWQHSEIGGAPFSNG